MSNQPLSSAQDPYAVLDAHRRRWHDQEVFLAAQLRILRQQQLANALAAALSDLRSAVPGAATVSFRMTPAGTAEPGGIGGQDGNYDIEGVSETAESALSEVLHAIAQLPGGDRRALDCDRTVRGTLVSGAGGPRLSQFKLWLISHAFPITGKVVFDMTARASSMSLRPRRGVTSSSSFAVCCRTMSSFWSPSARIASR